MAVITEKQHTRENCFNNIKYTILHRKAFRKTEKELFGKVSFRGYFHDIDKLLLYLFFDKKTVSKIHRRFSKHHINKAKSLNDFKEMVVDWECARYTKPDKPLNAYETLYAYYPQLENDILPILHQLKIDNSQ